MVKNVTEQILPDISFNAANKVFEHEDDSDGSKKASQMTPEKALALLINTGMSKSSYMKIRQYALEHNHDLYP